ATDQGFLFTDTWKGKVSQVLLKKGKILHYMEGDQPPPAGTLVKGTLDWNRRYLNMRLHSAGHVVDFALYLLGYSPSPLMPFKGEHEKKPVIYYQGTIEKDFQEELEKKPMNSLLRIYPSHFALLIIKNSSVKPFISSLGCQQ